MSWSQDFKETLARGRYEPRYLLEWVGIPQGATRVFGGNIRLSSFQTAGYDAIISRVDSGVSGGVLSLRDWGCNPLVFEVGIVGDSARGRDIRRIIQRGQAVRLLVGFSDDPSTFQQVAVGTVYGLSLSGAGWVIRCKGLEGSLSSRIAITATEQALGWDLGNDTLSSGVANPTSTIDVPDASIFRLDDSTIGAVLITANNASTYYCTFTGTSAGTGAGGSDQLTGVTVGAFGTSHSATSAGNAIAEVMLAVGHPLEIAAKILTSTGSGSNGVYDTLPESWGLGIPADCVDLRDIVSFRDLTQPSSGADDWRWVQPSAVADPGSSLAAFLNPCGYFLTQHQGRVTARAALEPWLDTVPGHITITDAMIVPGSLRYDAWDPDSPVEYEKCRILYTDGTTGGTSAASDLDHIPGRGTNEHTAGGLWSTSTNAAAIVSELISRLKHWDQRTAEVLSFELIGWWPGLTSPGSTVGLDLTVISSRTGGNFNTRGGLVLRCSPDWFGSSTPIEVAILPADEVVPWRPVS